MKKNHISPKQHWTWPFPVTHSQAVTCGDLVWISGQMDLDAKGRVRNAGNLAKQVSGAAANLSDVASTAGSSLSDVVKLLCIYVNDGSVDEQALLADVGKALPEGVRPAVTAVPVSYLPFPGALVSLDSYAMNGSLIRTRIDPVQVSPLPKTFTTGLRCGKMIFISGQSPVTPDGKLLHADDILAQTRQVMTQVGAALAEFGADFADVVKINRWYVGKGKTEDFEPAALECAKNFSEPGPAATGIPVPLHARDGQLIKIEVVAMLGEDGAHLPRRHVWPDSLWDWTINIPYYHGLKCHDMIFLGGQVSLDTQGHAVNPHNMRAQTAQAMVHIGSILAELGAGYDDICKLTTMYAGPPGADALAENMQLRSAFFEDPGPASTDISFPVLAYPGMIIEIDAFAMAEPD
ncbi:RidA family protein [Aestuariivirga sp.]|uniref:RidA family protein n=1 Tax=Aestuariivirga sp. TaxID=2650926 RepID=UPI0039E71271